MTNRQRRARKEFLTTDLPCLFFMVFVVATVAGGAYMHLVHTASVYQ